MSDPTPEPISNPLQVHNAYALIGAAFRELSDAQGSLLDKATLSGRAHWRVQLASTREPSVMSGTSVLQQASRC
jgi:hypothetical protein